jgi:hypothetical protein
MPGGESIPIVVGSSIFQMVAFSLCIIVVWKVMLVASYGNFCVSGLFHLVFVQVIIK